MVRRIAPLAVALVLVLGGTETASADHRYRFLQFNVCGSVMRDVDHPQCNSGRIDTGMIEHVRSTVESFQPHVVSLNEVCKTQFDRIYWDLNYRGVWKVHGHFTPTDTTSTNCEGETFGNAIFVREPIFGSPVETPLPHVANGEQRKITCLVTALARGTVVCSTHVASNDAYQEDQIVAVRNAVSNYVANGTPTVVLGDFNVEPNERRLHDDAPDERLLDRIYDTNYPDPYGFGVFRELDETHGEVPKCRCGENTYDDGPKIDYIFVSRYDWSTLNADAITSPYSDHHQVRGWATLVH
jgi:endonuclease/exonuclease/phosphatase family metal-dependent hydrolase